MPPAAGLELAPAERSSVHVAGSLSSKDDDRLIDTEFADVVVVGWAMGQGWCASPKTGGLSGVR